MLVIFFPADMKEQFFSLLLYYMLLKRRTDKPKIKTFQIALHAYKRVTQHMGTPLSDIDISFRKSKGFNLRSLTPKISICHGSFLLFMILVCFWPVLKHRWTNIEGIVFPAKLHITHSELFRLFACFKWVLVARAKGSFAGFTEKFHSWYFFLSFIDNWQKLKSLEKMFRLLSPIKLTVRDALQQKQNATDTLQTSLIVNYYKIQITKLKKIPSFIS